jgi:uncharacterized ParB-like nuclease family protein
MIGAGHAANSFELAAFLPGPVLTLLERMTARTASASSSLKEGHGEKGVFNTIEALQYLVEMEGQHANATGSNLVVFSQAEKAEGP